MKLTAQFRKIINEELKNILLEYDKKFYATPEWVKENLDDAFNQAKKKLGKFAQKGYLTESEVGSVVSPLRNVAANLSQGDGEKGAQNSLRKKYGSQEEQNTR